MNVRLPPFLSGLALLLSSCAVASAGSEEPVLELHSQAIDCTTSQNVPIEVGARAAILQVERDQFPPDGYAGTEESVFVVQANFNLVRVAENSTEWIYICDPTRDGDRVVVTWVSERPVEQ